MTTQEAFVDSVDLNQTAQNAVWSLIYTVHMFILDYNWSVSSSGTVFLANEKTQFIYSVLKELSTLFRWQLVSLCRLHRSWSDFKETAVWVTENFILLLKKILPELASSLNFLFLPFPCLKCQLNSFIP